MPKGIPLSNCVHDWPPVMIERLKTLVAAGTSYGKVQHLLNNEFPALYKSRSAVIGKAGRLGLFKARPKTNDVIKRSPRPKGGRFRSRFSIKHEIILAPPFIPDIIELAPVSSILFSECDGNRCKWPTSEALVDMQVCGAPAVTGAYCSKHAAIAYRLLPTDKRNAHFPRGGKT